jgi:hypothetical protein
MVCAGQDGGRPSPGYAVDVRRGVSTRTSVTRSGCSERSQRQPQAESYPFRRSAVIFIIDTTGPPRRCFVVRRERRHGRDRL